jgi:hypothetical protein
MWWRHWSKSGNGNCYHHHRQRAARDWHFVRRRKKKQGGHERGLQEMLHGRNFPSAEEAEGVSHELAPLPTVLDAFETSWRIGMILLLLSQLTIIQ